VILPTGDQTAKTMQPGKQPFDLPTPTIAPQLATVLRFGSAAVALVGRDQFDAVLLFETRIQRIAVIGTVANQAFGNRRREALLDGELDELGFMRRSACNPDGERKTTAVRNCHDLGPFAAACWTNCTAPFLAPLNEASMKVSAKSNCPRANRSSARVRNTLTSVPSRTQRWKRRWQVWYGGNLSRGNSAHWAPVRKIHNTPSSTCRVSRHGRPRRLRGVFGSTNGSSNSHCTSVSSILTDVPVNPTSHNYLVRFVFMR
jgi:hypothetical protein